MGLYGTRKEGHLSISIETSFVRVLIVQVHFGRVDNLTSSRYIFKLQQRTFLCIYPSQKKGFISIDVTSAAKEWKAGHPNCGVVIWATNEKKAGRGTRFASKSESDPSKHPYIVVNCRHRFTGGSGPSTGNDGDAPLELDGP